MSYLLNSSDLELRSKKLAGKVLITVGVILLAVSVGIGSALMEGVPVLERTLGGLALAVLMVLGCEFVSRRYKSEYWNWFGTTLGCMGWMLSYFYLYATYYVPGLKSMDTPYVYWALAPLLGALGTWRGAKNPSMRWFSHAFTLLVTGHILYQTLLSPVVLDFAGMSVKVSAIGCFLGFLWCGALSMVYGKLEERYDVKTSTVDFLVHKVLHEAYFIFSVANAMLLPMLLSNIEQAPLWWSVEAPILLAYSWKRGNYIKHGLVGLMWAAAALVLVSSALRHPVGLEILLSVPLAGLAIGSAYRRLKSQFTQALKVAGYCGYIYASIAIVLLVPYLQFGNDVFSAMPFWMVESLVIAALGLALRDRFIHTVGWIAGLGSLALFGYQGVQAFLGLPNQWSWGLVGPVVACAYALSVAYGRLAAQASWREATTFLPFGWKETVSKTGAEYLETLWSWVGCVTILAASYLLVDSSTTVLWWSAIATLMVALGLVSKKGGYHVQGLATFALALLKVAIWDATGGKLVWDAEQAFTLYRAVELAVLGGCNVLAGVLYFVDCSREEARKAKEDAANKEVTPPAQDEVKGEDKGGSNDSSAN